MKILFETLRTDSEQAMVESRIIVVAVLQLDAILKKATGRNSRKHSFFLGSMTMYLGYVCVSPKRPKLNRLFLSSMDGTSSLLKCLRLSDVGDGEVVCAVFNYGSWDCTDDWAQVSSPLIFDLFGSATGCAWQQNKSSRTPERLPAGKSCRPTHSGGQRTSHRTSSKIIVPTMNTIALRPASSTRRRSTRPSQACAAVRCPAVVAGTSTSNTSVARSAVAAHRGHRPQPFLCWVQRTITRGSRLAVCIVEEMQGRRSKQFNSGSNLGATQVLLHATQQIPRDSCNLQRQQQNNAETHHAARPTWRGAKSAEQHFWRTSNDTARVTNRCNVHFQFRFCAPPLPLGEGRGSSSTSQPTLR